MRRLVNRQQRLMTALAGETFITNKNLYSLLVRPEAGLKNAGAGFMLGVLNSRLISRLYLSQVQQATKDDFPQVTITDVLALPCPRPDSRPAARISELAGKLAGLMPRLREARDEPERQTLRNAIMAADQKIDALVYELYGLTEEEIQLVEGGG
jgi:adenine-specific DNA-methyltransferase